tara:strand:- start:1094 stop:1726 length:633 start_codon:yes stop_codon:yes gene_type:complete
MIPDALTERFHHTLVRKNQSGQDYVSIDNYINRLNDVLGAMWSWSINDWKLYPDAAPPTSTNKPQYLAVVQGTLTIILSDIGVVSVGIDEDSFLTTQRAQVSRDGIGSDINFNPDTAVKTAQAEALKKCCHQFGIALYLWQEAERDFIALQKAATTNDIALKSLAVAYTQRIKDMDPATMPDKDTIMETLNVPDLSTTTIRGRFTEIGVL